MNPNKPGVNPPLWLLAELTYRCPLQCPYCSNPLDFSPQEREELTTEQWIEVFRQARAMGGAQLGFSGGEPLVRKDLAGADRRRARSGLLHQPDHLRHRPDGEEARRLRRRRAGPHPDQLPGQRRRS